MKTFRFPLQRVLEWRALQLRVEEEKLASLQQQLASLLELREKLSSARNRSESHLFSSGTAAGSDLQSWALYQARLLKQQELLKTQLLQCEKLTLEQRQRLLKARTDHRVLERLKERRWRQWMYLNEREVEDTAAEVYLSKWSREDLENKSAEIQKGSKSG
jgi:flagellar FliJ protein